MTLFMSAWVLTVNVAIGGFFSKCMKVVAVGSHKSVETVYFPSLSPSLSSCFHSSFNSKQAAPDRRLAHQTKTCEVF
jgi:hypothetical protein